MRPPALRPPRCATPDHGNRFALSTNHASTSRPPHPPRPNHYSGATTKSSTTLARGGHNDTTGVVATDTGEPPALLDGCSAEDAPVLDGSSAEDAPVSESSAEDAPMSESDFIVDLPQASVHYKYALDSLFENYMLESVPVAPGEQSLYEHAVAAAHALAASRARELSHKRKQRGSAPPAAIAVASWRRYS